MHMIAWNTDYIFQRVGGPPGLVALCQTYAPADQPPAQGTAAVWKHRARISADWIPVIVFGLIHRGDVQDPLDLFVDAAFRPPRPAKLIPSMEDVGL